MTASAILALAWAIAAFYISRISEAGLATAWAIAVLAGMIGLGAHIAGFQHLRDIGKAKG
jgi:hypothetical protein